MHTSLWNELNDSQAATVSGGKIFTTPPTGIRGTERWTADLFFPGILAAIALPSFLRQVSQRWPGTNR